MHDRGYLVPFVVEGRVDHPPALLGLQTSKSGRPTGTDSDYRFIVN